MVCLETINSSPHPNFPIITTKTLQEILVDTFEVDTQEMTTIKDILNMYSYIINGLPGTYALYVDAPKKVWHSYEFIIPDGGNLIEFAIVIALKLAAGMSLVVTSVQEKRDVAPSLHKTKFIKDILNLKFSGEDSVVKFNRMRRYEDVFKLTPTQMSSPMFEDKLFNKEFNIYADELVPKVINYIYVDFSTSMYAHQDMLFVLCDSISFNYMPMELHIFAVTPLNISLLGIARNKDELRKLLFKSASNVRGVIQYSNVINHSNMHPHQSTFLTDGDDFILDDFKRSTTKFNLISIYDEEIVKT